MHLPIEVKNDLKNSSLKNHLLDLEILIKDNFPTLPPEPKHNDSVLEIAFFSIIKNIQSRLAEILIFFRETIFLKEYSDSYANCTEIQKRALERFFEAIKILSLAMASKLAIKVIPEKAETKIRKICEECHYIEFKIKDPKALTQIKEIEIGKSLDYGLKDSILYTGFSGSTEVHITRINREHLSLIRKGTSEEVAFEYNKIADCLKELQNISHVKKPIDRFNLLLNKVERYVEAHPRDYKKQAFLTSIIEKKYDLAMRIACDCDNGRAYLLNLLLDCAKTGIIQLNLNAAGLNGKTALHWAAESAGKYGNLESIKSLLAHTQIIGATKLNFLSIDLEGKTAFHYAALLSNKNNNIDCLKILFDSVSSPDSAYIDFIKDKKNNTFEDYLNPQLKMDFNDYLNKKYISYLLETEAATNSKF